MKLTNAEIQRNFQRKVKKEAIIHYGGECVCCGEKEIKFLTIDHTKGNGKKHREKTGYSQIGYW